MTSAEGRRFFSSQTCGSTSLRRCPMARMPIPQLQNQHAIAVAKETIPLSHRFLVRAQDKFAIGKRAYQHEQSRTRQMKICQQNIDHPKLEWRIDKNIRFAFAGLNFSETALNRFQDSYRCCSDRDDALCIRDCLGCIRRNRKSLGMHLMLSDVFHFHRTKSCRPDVKRNENVRKTAQNLRREMQPGRRRRKSAVVFREHRLVARFTFCPAAVVYDHWPLDIRW